MTEKDIFDAMSEDNDDNIFGTPAEPPSEESDQMSVWEPPEYIEPKIPLESAEDIPEEPKLEEHPENWFPRLGEDERKHRFSRMAYSAGLLLLGSREEYKMVRKLLLYTIVGAIACKKLAIDYGAVQIDTRLSAILDMPPESGKSVLKNHVKAVCEFIGMECAEVLPGFHEEQLVGYTKNVETMVEETEPDGSVRKRKKKNIEYRYGWLSLDVLLFDEAMPLLYDPDYQQAQNYMKISQDTYPTNFLTKWRNSDDVPIQDRMRYASPSSLMIFLQPDPENKLKAHLLDSGFMRRFFLVTLKPDQDEKIRQAEGRSSVFRDEKRWMEEQKSHLFEAFKVIKTRVDEIAARGGFVFARTIADQEAIDSAVNDISHSIIGETSGRGETIKAYGTESVITLTNKLLVMMTLRSIVDNNGVDVGVITSSNTKTALEDLKLIWKHQVNFVAEQFLLDRREKSLMNKVKYDRLIEEMQKKGMTGENTGMDRGEFIRVLAEFAGVKEASAENHIYQELRRRGRIFTNTGKGRPQTGTKAVVWVGKDIDPFYKGTEELYGKKVRALESSSSAESPTSESGKDAESKDATPTPPTPKDL